MSRILMAIALFFFVVASASCGDGGLEDKCRKACEKIAKCDENRNDELDAETSCYYRCDEPDLMLNEDLADCILTTSCEDLQEKCF